MAFETFHAIDGFFLTIRKMKRLPGALLGFALVACQTAQTQVEPQITVVPHGAMSRTSSRGQAVPAEVSVSQTPPSQNEGSASLSQPLRPASPSAAPAISAPSSAPPANPAPSSLPPATPTPKYSYTSCNVNGPYIALTFDDGPSEQLTPRLLDILKERGIKVTFFVVGRNVAEYPDIVRRMDSEGHEIANHSWSHPALTQLGAEGVRKQIENTNEEVFKTTGKRPVLMRPPYGSTNPSLNKRFNEAYRLKVVLWSVDPLDWKYRNSNRVFSSIVQNAHPGAIILAHDIHATTVAAMPETLDTLLGKGYKFVTVSELISMELPEQLVKKESAQSPAPSP